MADFRIRGVVTLTFLNDPAEPFFESESVVLVERWLELSDTALALNPAKTRTRRHRAHLLRYPRQAIRNLAGRC